MKRIRETIEVAEPLWRALEQMSHDLGVDRDALVAQALFLLAKQNGYVAPTPVLLGATSAVAQSIPVEAPATPRPPAAEPRAPEPVSRPAEAVAAVAAVSPAVKEPAAPAVAVEAQEPAKAAAPVSDDVAFVRTRMKEVLAAVDATVLPRDVPVPSDEAESEQEADDEEPSDEDESDGNDVASDDDEESEEDEEESDEDEATGDTGESDMGEAEDEASDDSADSGDEKPADAEEDSEDDASIAAAVGAETTEGSDEEASDDAGAEDDSAEEEDSRAEASDEQEEQAHGEADAEEPEESRGSGKRQNSTNVPQAPQPLELFVRLAPGGPAVMVDVPRFTLGRGPNCSLTVKSGRVSREHAAIVRVGNDFFIEDLDSSNGTWINHQRIKRQKIEDGDTFNLGTEAVYFSMGPRED
ncbi:FHA domain-containing protein [Corallococcus sicarius]|uniref:FHA domain-containing protein n=1 Tax=Corallococcus sicarius TaxID=2316726 RepID=A0A3A8NDQ9_9BACT|nr:FHA domain-containing protein [Corallococcus sicarius]RKH42123.1 FHA domain-containing protein [Corallococcus sicarius]